MTGSVSLLRWMNSWQVRLDGEGFRRVLVAVGTVVHAVELDVDRGRNAHIDRKFLAVEADRLATMEDGGVEWFIAAARIEIGVRTTRAKPESSPVTV